MNYIVDKIKPARGCKILLLLLSFVVPLLLFGCTGEDKPKVDNTLRDEYSKDGMQLKIAVDGKIISIADDLSVRLEAVAPVGWEIEYAPAAQKFDGFSQAGTPDIQRIHKNDGKTVEQVMLLSYEPVNTGNFKLPVFKVVFKNKDKSITLESKPLEIKVASLIADISKAKLKDIPGVLELKKDYFYWYIAGVAAVVVLAVIAVVLVIIWLRRRARYNALCRPFYTALRQLDNLEKSGEIKNGNDDYICTTVSNVLREYIEDRFGIIASKCTTEEFLVTLSDKNLLISNYSELLTDFLQSCDVVKFAKYVAGSDECLRILKCCRDFVLSTKREEINYNGEFGKITQGMDQNGGI